MDECGEQISSAISELFSLTKNIFGQNIDEKDDNVVICFKRIIKLSLSTLFSYINEDKKEANDVFPIINTILSSLNSKKKLKFYGKIWKYYKKISIFLLTNMCFNMHYTKSFSLIEKITKTVYFNDENHKEILHICFLNILTLLITMRGPPEFLDDKITYKEISDYIDNVLKNSEQLKQFCVDKDKYVGRLATEFLKLEIQPQMINILIKTFDDKSICEIYKDQQKYTTITRSKMYVDTSYVSVLFRNVDKLIDASKETPFNILFSNCGKNKHFYPSNPPFAFEREVFNKMGISVPSLCGYNHCFFVPINTHNCSPIVSLPNECPFCKANGKENEYLSFEVPMYYQKECNPYDTDFLQEVGPMGPIETHILRVVLLTISLRNNEEDGSFYIDQLNTVIRCVGIMLFPYVSPEQSFDASISFICDVISRLIPFFNCLKSCSLYETVSCESNICTFRSLFAEAISHVLQISFENVLDDANEKLWKKKSKKIIRPTTSCMLLRKFLLNPFLRKKYPLCYHFLRLSSSLKNYQKIIPIIKKIESSKTDDSSIDFSKIDWKDLIYIRKNGLLTNDMRNEIKNNEISSKPLQFARWIIPELVISFISSHNEFISIIDEQLHIVSPPNRLTDDSFCQINTEEVMNLIVESSYEHLCTDYTPSITSKTETVLRRYFKKKQLSFISLDFFSLGACVTSISMTPKLMFQNRFKVKELDAQQSLFINKCVINSGRGQGLKLFAEKLMSITQDKKELQMNIVDYVIEKSMSQRGIVLNEIENDGYDAFLDAKSMCSREFTVNQLPSIVDLISAGKYAHGGSINILAASTFSSVIKRIDPINHPEINIDNEKKDHIFQIQEVALLLITHIMEQRHNMSIESAKIENVLNKIVIPSYNSHGLEFFEKHKDKPIKLAEIILMI